MNWIYDADSKQHVAFSPKGPTYMINAYNRGYEVIRGEKYLGTRTTLDAAKALAEADEEAL